MPSTFASVAANWLNFRQAMGKASRSSYFWSGFIGKCQVAFSDRVARSDSVIGDMKLPRYFCIDAPAILAKTLLGLRPGALLFLRPPF